MTTDKKRMLGLGIAGLAIGAVAILLTAFGNPANMGFCIACFLRDTAGALKLHSAAAVQYARPEIPGLVLGALIAALAGREFSVRGGSSPVTRFFLGFFVTVGALMFLGCPLRMVLRIAGGDLNAIVGLVGFAVGILGGVVLLQKGFSLRKSQRLPAVEGLAFPVALLAVLLMLVAAPTLLAFSESGPGSMRAPILLSLAAGLAVGVLAQRTRLCMVGGLRDAVMFRDFTLLTGFLGILAAALVGNLLLNKFSLGFEGQPVAYNDWLWNGLGMVLVGLGSVLLGGCPLRQLILAGSGSGDAAVAVLGMLAGAAACHNFGLASSGEGPTANGKIAVVIGIVIVAAIGLLNIQKKKEGCA